MELEVPIASLYVPSPKGSAKGQTLSRETWKIAPDEQADRELKLIGLRVEEALDLLEPFLNHASLAGMREVRIIHGLGTGRLRAAVREHLAHHPLVDEFRAGEPHEGRDGATVVTLRI